MTKPVNQTVPGTGTFTLPDRSDELRGLLMEIYTAYTAYTSGALCMQSHDVGDPENGIPLRPWHEEWFEGVKEILEGEKS